MRPKISMWSDYGSPTSKRWRSRRRRNTQSPTGLRILLIAGASVAGVIGISGVYPQIIDSEWARGMRAHSQGIVPAEKVPFSVGLTQEPQPPSRGGSLNSSGSRAMLTAIRRASSFVSTFAWRASAFVLARVDVSERLTIGVTDHVAAGHRVGVPRRREAAGWFGHHPSFFARRAISASRSQRTFDSVALRLTAPLLKLGKDAKPGHLPDTSTIRPWSTPKPASRSAVLNSSEVICGFFLKGRMVLRSTRQPLQQPRDLHRAPVTMARWRGHAPLVERRSNALQLGYAGCLKRGDKGSKIGRPRISTRLAGFQAGLESGRGEAVKMLRHELPTFRAAALARICPLRPNRAAPRAPDDLAQGAQPCCLATVTGSQRIAGEVAPVAPAPADGGSGFDEAAQRCRGRRR